MTHIDDLSFEELHDAYIEIQESFDEARTSLDELQTDVTDGLSEFTMALDDLRDELERCNHTIRRLSRWMSPVLTYMIEQEELELTFPPKKPTTKARRFIPVQEVLNN